MKIFFTSDLHLGHDNIRIFCNRPFGSVEDMDESMIERWNNVVGKKDLVYILGDFAWNDTKYYVERLNGTKILIKGNHDIRTQHIEKYFKEVHKLLDIKIDGVKLTLCHYAMMSWNCKTHGAWHLHGHSHGNLPHPDLAIDVGVDCHEFTPVSWDKIKQILTDKANNLMFEYHKDIIGWIRIKPNYGYAIYKSKTPSKTVIITPVHGTQPTRSINEVDIRCSEDGELYIKYLGDIFYYNKICWRD